MATNNVYEGDSVPITESDITHPTHADGFVDSGDAVVVGSMVGVALTSASAATDTIEIATEGVWDLPVIAVTATANSAIAVGDKLYIGDADAKGTGTLTSDATAPSDGDTVTIGDTVYTYRTALTDPAVPYEVLIGVSAAVALDNLKSAINATAGAGTTYGTGTSAHPLVTATTNTNTTQVVQAISNGGPAIATTEASSHLSWGDTTTIGGALIGTLTKTSAKTGFGIALEAVESGEAATIPVLIKRNM